MENIRLEIPRDKEPRPLRAFAALTRFFSSSSRSLFRADGRNEPLRFERLDILNLSRSFVGCVESQRFAREKVRSNVCCR